MRAAVDPREALAVLEGEAAVSRVALGGGVGGGIRAHDFEVLGSAGIAFAHHGQRQQRQGIRFDEEGARRGRVTEFVGGIFPQHLVGTHLRPLIRGVGISHEHIRLRGIVGGHVIAAGGKDVQIFPQRIDPAGKQEGVFLVGIVTGGGRIVLVINAARGRHVSQKIPAPDALGQHNFTGVRGITHRVAADFARHIEVVVGLARGAHLLEPAHRQVPRTRVGIDRDDGPEVGGLHADDERILVGGRIVARAAGDVAAHLMPGGRGNTRAHGGAGALIDAGRLIALHRGSERGRACGRRERTSQRETGRIRKAGDGGSARDEGTRNDHAHLQPGRAAHGGGGDSIGGAQRHRTQRLGTVLRLGIEGHIPGGFRAGELEQGPVALVAPRIHQQRLRGGVHGGFNPRRVVLENQVR